MKTYDEETLSIAISETAHSWKQRCYNICAAIGVDIGEYELSDELGDYKDALANFYADPEVYDKVSDAISPAQVDRGNIAKNVLEKHMDKSES